MYVMPAARQNGAAAFDAIFPSSPLSHSQLTLCSVFFFVLVSNDQTSPSPTQTVTKIWEIFLLNPVD